MNIYEVLEILENYKLRMPPTAYYELKSDIVNYEETPKKDLAVEDCIKRSDVLDKIQRLIAAEVNNIDKNGDYMNYARERVNAYEAIQFFVENEVLCPIVHPKYGAEDYIPKHKIYAAIKEIKEEKAITSAEIIENDRQDLVNYKTALNYCLEILEQHIKGNEGE